MLLAQILCVGLGLLVATARAENFTWLGLATDSNSVQPPARHSAAMGAWNDKFYVFGGFGNKINGTKLLGELSCMFNINVQGENLVHTLQFLRLWTII